MPLHGDNPKSRHWERNSLPVIDSITPGNYSNPNLTVDEYGRVTAIGAGAVGSGLGIQNDDVAVDGGPFVTMNFVGGKITAAANGTDTGQIDISVSSAGTIAVLEEGTIVTGGPFSSINFIGDGITATDGGAGQLNLTVDNASVPNTVRYVKANTGVAASQNVGAPIDPDGIVRTVSVTITTPYAAGATLEVQDGAGGPLLPASRINPEVTGTYTMELPGNDTAIANPQIVLVVGGAPATGFSVVEVLYEVP